MKGDISMSINELSRLEIIIKVTEKKLKQSKAADILDISISQIKRLVKRYRIEGPTGLISRKRGALGNHCLQQGLKELAIFGFFKLLTNTDPKSELGQSFRSRVRDKFSPMGAPACA